MALLHVDSYSDVLGRNIRLDAVLPEREPGDWKCLLLLHGLTDDNTIWQRRTSIERYAQERGMAVIMPTTRLGWYTNTAWGERYFDYIADELPLICRRMFPRLSSRREDNFVAGLSMGGYGALKCALLRPERFSKAACLSGALDVASLVNMPHDDFNLKENFFEDVFGQLDKLRGSENDLFRAAKLLKKDRPEVYIWCGMEDDLHPMNLSMRDHLLKLGYEVSYSEGPGGHNWLHWDREIAHAMNWMLGKEEWEWL